jgi:hypothetical protein
LNTVVSNALAPNSEWQASFIGGGSNNTVSGNSAAIVAGLANAVAANYATVVGGIEFRGLEERLDAIERNAPTLATR